MSANECANNTGGALSLMLAFALLTLLTVLAACGGGASAPTRVVSASSPRSLRRCLHVRFSIAMD